mgnify:CR=1 FL=1
MDDHAVYEGRVEGVFSGDDLVIMVDLRTEDLFKRQRVRLDGVDTPNAVGLPEDSPAGKVRKEVLSLVRNRSVRISRIRRKSTSWVAVVEILGDRPLNLNDYLIQKGYDFKRREPQ